MPIKRLGKWAGRSPAGNYGHRRRRSAHRPLRGFELLEDRRLLAMLTVNSLADDGSGGLTLREAVAAAGTNDTITFSVTGMINLKSTGSGHIVVSKNLTIQGPGANLLTIKAYDPDANGNNDSDGRRVFYVSNGSSSLLNVTISGLTLTNGDPEVSDENKGGGAIFNEENLTLSGCVLTGNFAPNGGAIYSKSGTLAITDCTITGNAGGDGGGLLVEGGSVAITRSTISNNQVTNSGGGVVDRGRPMTITDSTISGNCADERGGGLYLYQGSLTVTGSTISGNTSDDDDDQDGSGGGIFNLGGGLSISNSTISGNMSGEDGGGIFSDTSQTITISHSTIFGNSVTNHSGNDGGGIRSPDSATLNHTIVAGNFKGSTRDDVSGSFSASYSLIGDRRSASVTNVGGSSLIGTSSSPIDPKLGPLASNGGLTNTHALLVGSPAIDAGNMSAVAGAGGIPLYDQRGTPYSRVVDFDGIGGARIDIGATEKAPLAPALLGDYNRNNVVDAGDYVLWRKTQGASVPIYSGADGNGNGMIDAGDFGVWRAHFGQVFMPAAASASSISGANLNSGGELEAANSGSGASKTRGKSAAGAAFMRESPTSGFSTALDLLLAFEPAYSPSDAMYDTRLNEDGDETIDAAPAFDIALDATDAALAGAIGAELGGP